MNSEEDDHMREVKIPDLETETTDKKKKRKKNKSGGDNEQPFKPKVKYPTILKNFKNYFTEYSENTSLHGIRYLGEQHRTIIEKFWWFVVFVISLYICIGLIMKTYQKWDDSPVIVSFAQSPTPVWRIPFPAVTICSETKARQRKYNFTEYYHKMINSENMTDEELKRFGDISLMCDNHLYNGGENTTNLGTIDFLTRVAPQFDESMWQCKWTTQNETCDTLYTRILTEEGACFTFNMLDRDEIFTNQVFHNGDYLKHGLNSHGWTIENGYESNQGKDTFPRRAMSAGAKAGITMLLRAYEQDLDYICKGPVQGFKILLHHPAEVPQVSLQYFRAPLNQEVIVAVKPDMMTTAAGLRGYDPHRRHCYFSTERNLRFYKNYTQQNCEVECLTNYTFIQCRCVAYHMPHDESTPICGPANIRCMADAQASLLIQEVEKGISRKADNNDDDDDDNPIKQDCDCLPACTTLTYNAETSQADFNWQALFTAFKANFSEFPGVQMTRVTIFFKEMQFITSQRNELYGITDFLANCGGLLGLFIGFSFISAIEIFYFLSLRLMCNVKKYGRYFWSASPELINNDAYEHPK